MNAGNLVAIFIDGDKTASDLGVQCHHAIVERVSKLNPANLDRDDVTILLLQTTGAGPTLAANLWAPFRLLGRVRDRIA